MATTVIANDYTVIKEQNFKSFKTTKMTDYREQSVTSTMLAKQDNQRNYLMQEEL